jgi:hypothetical protein
MDRPDDYYRKNRTKLFSQGDIFARVPFLDIGTKVDDVATFQHHHAMLITPTQVMRGRGATDERSYATPATRTVIPVLSLEQVDRDREGLVEDELLHYMYLPAIDAIRFPDSAAVLSEPTLVSHDLLSGLQRVTQLTVEATRQLQRKLVLFLTMIRSEPRRDDFDPWAD